MGTVKHLRCVYCGRCYREGETETTCMDCGIEGILDVIYDESTLDGDTIRQELARDSRFSLWRYSAVLPAHDDAVRPPVPVGWSPLFRCRRLEHELRLSRLWIKDDGRNPSASLKDRASAIAITRAMMQGCDTVACASTGNAATSLAGMAAQTGLDACIFIPEAAPVAKQMQLVVYGAKLFLVQGSYTDTFTVATAAIDRFDWYNRNCAINPYLVEGKKTVAWEIAEQSGWDPPTTVFAPIGDGCTIAGIYKGFDECHRLGLIGHLPRIIGVQAEGAAPVFNAWHTGQPMVPLDAHTIADSISVGHPKNHRKALDAVRGSGGDIITVSDEEIIAAMSLLGMKAGVFGEPSGVTGFAGLLKLLRNDLLDRGESFGIIVTGNGLKDIAAVQSIGGKVHTIPASLDAVEKVLRQQ